MNNWVKDNYGIEYPVGTKPYIIRAIYEWSIDNEQTPQILVNADCQGVIVPIQYIRNSRIILDLHPRSVDQLVLGNFEIAFSARFAGQSFQVVIPVASVMAIYGGENGQGVIFQEEPDSQPVTEDVSRPAQDRADRKGAPDGGVKEKPSTAAPHLKLVK